VAWLETAFSETEARPRGVPGRLTVTVGKSGRDVMVRGRAGAAVTVPCARTLDPVDVDLDAEVFLLLSPAGPRIERAPRSRKERQGGHKKQRSAEKVDAHAESSLDAARDAFDGEEVVLDDFIREFLLLELPMFPLRPDLRSAETTGMAVPSPAGPEPDLAHKSIDPRLAPLAQIASRLSEKKRQ